MSEEKLNFVANFFIKNKTILFFSWFFCHKNLFFKFVLTGILNYCKKHLLKLRGVFLAQIINKVDKLLFSYSIS